jgi:S-adenosylmethionine hydrolase
MLRGRRVDSGGSDPQEESEVTIVAILTDFGIKDGNVGVMKGVIWGICPAAQIADISHLIGPQDVREAALILARSATYFPAGTVHLAVVDPGVGTERRPMAARLGTWYYVGPDNGVITLLLERARAEGWPRDFIALDRPAYWLPDVSHVFHGRDIFAPVAAHLANGVPLLELGTPFSDPVLLDLPQPHREGQAWTGEIIHIDHFGNVASNIRVEHLGYAVQQKEHVIVRLGRIRIEGLVNTFGERMAGEVVALLGSTGDLIVSIVNGNAASVLETRVGDPIEVIMPWPGVPPHPGADG